MDSDEDCWLGDIFETKYMRVVNHKPNKVIPSWPGNPCCEIRMISKPQNLNIENKEEENMTKLYKANVAGTEQYVTLIGRDGADYVVKVSDTEKLVAVKEITEVMPDTIAIKYNSSFGGVPSKEYSFIVDDLSKFTVGDLLIIEGSTDLATVVRIDNKNATAQKKLVARRVMTEAI